MDYKRYLKTEYRQHCRADESPCPDHCRRFALSDPANKCFAESDCFHEHSQKCDSCEQINEATQAIEKKITELSSNMYSQQQHEELKYDFKQAKDNVYNWKAHILRAENQEEGKQDVIRNMGNHDALLLMDWAMKFTHIKYREKQTEWFAKRGMNWHVSSVVTKDGRSNLQVVYFAHLFDSCTQDWFAVVSLLESLIQAIKEQVDPQLKRVFLRSDEAGCYHNVNLYAAAKDVVERMNITVERYDHSEPQFGKDITDRIICPMKGCLRRYCNEGNNIVSAEDMHKALKTRSVRGTTAAVCAVQESSQNLSLKKLKGFSAFHNVRYEHNGLRVWKAFGIGEGKLIPWNGVYIHHQGPTNIQTSKDNDFFSITSKNIEVQPRQNNDPEAEDKLFKCQFENCGASFTNIEEVEAHQTFFEHKSPKCRDESLFDTLRRQWVAKFSSVDDQQQQDKAVITESIADATGSPTLKKGWALHKPRGKGSRFSEKVLNYLTAKYNIGETTKHKCDPLQVSKDMRKATDESGERLFTQGEWLTKKQVQVNRGLDVPVVIFT